MPRDEDAPPADAPPAPPVRRGLFGRLRNYFLTGLIVTAPLGITIWILLGVVELIDDSVAPLLPPAYTPQFYVEKYLGVEAHIPGVGLVAVLVGLTAIGLLTANFVGRMVVRTGESLLGRIPVVRSVYGALKQIFQTVLENSSRSFREVVLVEYPRRGIWAIGFITSATEGEVQTTIADEVVNVFLPTTPNPTSGFLLFVPRAHLVTLDMTVEEGIKMVVSAGIVTPPDARPEARRRTRVSSAGALGREAADTAEPMPRTVSRSAGTPPPDPARTGREEP